MLHELFFAYLAGEAGDFRIIDYYEHNRQGNPKNSMRIPNIYTASHVSEHASIEIKDQAAQHLSKVLRMKVGHRVQLFNGGGKFYPAEIQAIQKKSVLLATGAAIPSNTESRLHTHLGQVISRGDRMDYAIQKSTELGVNEITPLFSERCEVRLDDERQIKRQVHWQQIAISAAEQCGRACIPTVHAPENLNQWVQRQTNGISLVLHHRDTCRIQDIADRPEQVNLLVGPEGGLSDEEISSALEKGFQASTFGPRVFRTETAPVAALAVLQWLWGDFQ